MVKRSMSCADTNCVDTNFTSYPKFKAHVKEEHYDKSRKLKCISKHCSKTPKTYKAYIEHIQAYEILTQDDISDLDNYEQGATVKGHHKELEPEDFTGEDCGNEMETDDCTEGTENTEMETEDNGKDDEYYINLLCDSDLEIN